MSMSNNTSFKHSTARVPRLYKEAGKILQKVKEEGGSFKGLVFQSKHTSLKSLYALVAETLRHGSELDALLRNTQLLSKEPRLDPWLARVLITELLWRQRPLSGPAIPLKIVQSYKPQLLSLQADLPIHVTESASRVSRPRFVRINSLKATKSEILNFFAQDGWQELDSSKQHFSTDEEKYANFIQTISTLSENQFIQDIHVENLLIFPGNLEFYNLDYYRDGSLLLQDKASCMSAHLLNAEPGSTVLDMCAAPGMKTTHIAATINNLGTVYAIEKHQGRYNSLCRVVTQSGASCVKPILGDALDFSSCDLPDVEYIAVDPTCSGSGMTMRRELFNDLNDVSKFRLDKLSAFQCTILRHAMTNFPKVKRIVYSTCSVCPEENEAVVEAVLNSTPPNFIPVIPVNGTQWMKRGSSSYKFGTYGLYARPENDSTNGFFVVVFERTDNEYQSGKAVELVKDLSSVKDTNGKKKKKDKKKHNLEANGVSETYSNPALERMRKAMENFSSSQTVFKDNNLKCDNSYKMGMETCINKRKRREDIVNNISEEVMCVSDVKTADESSKKDLKKHKKGKKHTMKNQSELSLSERSESSYDNSSEECIQKRKKKKQKT